MGYDLIRYLIIRLLCGESLEEGPRFLVRIRDTAFNELDVELTNKDPERNSRSLEQFYVESPTSWRIF